MCQARVGDRTELRDREEGTDLDRESAESVADHYDSEQALQEDTDDGQEGEMLEFEDDDDGDEGEFEDD